MKSDWHNSRARGKRARIAAKKHFYDVARSPRGVKRMTVTQLSRKYKVGRETIYQVFDSLPQPIKWGYLSHEPMEKVNV